MKNNIIISFLLSISFGCSEEDCCVSEEVNLPTSIIFKDIPSGTFTMGGTTTQNDAPIVSITMSSFKISEKEITNQEYI